MTNTELNSALQHIRNAGYSAVIECNALIIEDPVYSCGLGDNAGKLIPSHHNLVTIRRFGAALKFVSDRS